MAVDRGYVGTPTLPTATIQQFSLPFLRNIAATLADGSSISVDVHLATIRWHKAIKDVEVICLEDRPLIGMLLLDGSEMNVHFKNGGRMELLDGP
jgi:clan AA aspartic protease